MTLSKLRSYITIQCAYLILAGIYQTIWLFSNVCSAIVMDSGSGPYGSTHNIEYVEVVYVVESREYHSTYFRNAIPKNTESIEIKYLKFAPGISRPNNLSGNWGIVFAIFLVYFISLTIIFLTPDLIPNGATFRFSSSSPYLSVIKKSN